MNAADDHDDEEELPEPPTCTTLVIGRSNTGKSSLLRALIKQYEPYQKVVYVANDLTNTSPYTRVSLEDLPKLPRGILIVEDVINASNQMFKTFQFMLNFKNHHHKVNPIFIVSHALHRQNLTGLLPYFTDIRLTACKSNIHSFNRLLNYYGFSKEEKERFTKQFLAVDVKYSHFHLHVPQLSLTLQSFAFEPLETDGGKGKKKSKGNSSMELFQGRRMSKKDATAFKNAHRFLGEKLVKNSSKAIALFELIYTCLPKTQVNVHTLTVTLQRQTSKTRGKGSKVAVSLIDFVSCLVDPHREPTPTIALFHEYLIRVHHVILPNVYLVNKRFW